MIRATLFASSLLLAACAWTAPAEVVLLGEQHDAPRHQALHRTTVEALASQKRLAALALEMAEQGTGTAGLPADASEAAVRQALHWDDRAWPWPPYAPVVMATVRAGVPVLGANLPRQHMRQAMTDPALDNLLDAAALQAQRQAIREGHCGVLPESEIAPMARVQIARDQAMAQTLAAAAQPGRVVVLISGAGHVDPQLGVVRHLPPGLRVRSERWPAEPPSQDHCQALRERRAGR